MKPLSEEELTIAAEQDWATYEYEPGNLYRTTFVGGYRLGYARCIRQMQDEFNELLKACHTSLQNQTNVDVDEIINQMKRGQDGRNQLASLQGRGSERDAAADV